MRFRSTHWIKDQGVDGFKTIEELRLSRLMAVPRSPGIYLILKNDSSAPQFLTKSTAGWSKGRDPTISPVELSKHWIFKSPILYIGKAGSSGNRSILRSRLKAYLNHGVGKSVAHWGGRAIWQIQNAEQLIVAWKIVTFMEPRDFEKRWLEEFKREFGSRPFANRNG